MTVPTCDQFIEPILRFLARNPEGAPAKFVHDAAASALRLTDEDRLQMLTSGTQPVYKIVLIDGPRPAGLMIDYGIGVSARVIKIPKIDSDYLDENAV